MKKVYDAVCTIGEYTNKDGEKKKQYLTVGAVMENDDGNLSLKLNAIPTNFNGWVNFYLPKEDKKDDFQKEVKKQGMDKDKSGGFDDDIPFAQHGKCGAGVSWRVM